MDQGLSDSSSKLFTQDDSLNAIADATDETLAFNYVVEQTFPTYISSYDPNFKVNYKLSAVEVIDSILHIYCGSHNKVLQDDKYKQAVTMLDRLETYLDDITPWIFVDFVEKSLHFNGKNQAMMASKTVRSELRKGRENSKKLRLMMKEVLVLFELALKKAYRT